MRLITLITLLIFLTINIFGQLSVKQIDEELTVLYKNMQQERSDTVSDLFKKKLTYYLSSPLTFHNKLNSLYKLMIIVSSPDKKIKFYSWDDRLGGSWHSINALAQYKTNTNKIACQQIDTDDEAAKGGYTDSEIYKVNQITYKGMTYYVTFGWGTHGAGQQHEIIQLFKIAGKKIIRVKAFSRNRPYFAIEYSRSHELNLGFNKKDNSISIDEVGIIYDGTQKKKVSIGKKKVLRFINGMYK